MKNTGIMIDCSRNAVRRPETVKRIADIMSEMGFDTLMLYTEDTYEIEGHPYFGYMRGRYSAGEIRDIDNYCSGRGIELVPCIQTLAHLNGIARWKEYEPIIDCNDILLVGDERTYELIESMFKAVTSMFSSKRIHIGMDEAWMLGAGKYLRKNGYKEQKDIMREHLKRVLEIAKRYGLEPMMWSDMFFQMSIGENTTDSPEVINEDIRSVMPEGITPVYWDYYSNDKAHYDAMMKAHKNFGRPFWFAGGLWTWAGFAPHNLFSIKAAKAAVPSCAENGTEGMFFTVWGDDGAEASVFSILPSMYYVSQLVQGINGENEIKKGFKDFTGIDFDDFMLIDIPAVTAKENGGGAIVNPDKYMLYNDCLLGIFDSVANEEDGELYGNTAKRLEPLTDNEEYGYIFRTIQSLCEVLAVKNDLGLRIRRAYKKGDKQELAVLADECIKAEALIGRFLESLKYQWYRENKPFGFEAQDIRIGGLMQRMRRSAERLKAYVNGEAEQIEELEEDILDPECSKKTTKKEIHSPQWSKYYISTM